MQTSSPRERLLDKDIQSLLRFKVRQLTRCPGFFLQEREDLYQELVLKLWERADAYDPDKASFYCFALVVIDRLVKTMIRARKAHLNNFGNVLSLDPVEKDRTGRKSYFPLDTTTDKRLRHRHWYPSAEFELLDLQADVQTVLKKLPKPLQELAEQLMEDKPATIRHQSARSRSQMRTQMQKLRAALQKGDLEKNKN